MRLPAYPLITVDPFFSIWSKSEKLYDSDTLLWCDIKKRISGVISVDGKKMRFMGKGRESVIEQTDLNVTPYVTYYSFECDKIRLSVRFWTPLLLNDLYMLSSPCSFIDCEAVSNDGKMHSVSIEISLGEEFCYNKTQRAVKKETFTVDGVNFAKMGRVEQTPLSKAGDSVAADWGYFYLSAQDVQTSDGKKDAVKAIASSESCDKFSTSIIAAYDDIYSIEYMGQKLKGLWTEKFDSITDAIIYCRNNHDELYNAVLKQNEMILNDAASFGEDYQNILTAAARQVLAAHKLIRNDKGELLYFSKECNSNGCINTVDVSYPAIAMYLIYNPELVKAMMTGIFCFARTPLWKFDFAPHDIGQYPIADGQVYALKGEMQKYTRELYKMNEDVFEDKYHMPVEECGNMLIMSYAYYFVTGDLSQAKENFDLLTKWSQFLVKKGVVLDNQLCTDDFAGHSEKNVNLAIKSIMGIACYAEISKAMGFDDDLLKVAKKYADELSALAGKNGYLSFAVGNDESWSLKYNLVWDIIFGFGLFDKNIYKKEIEKYNSEMNEYGVPLDFRDDFTKTDWMLWASALDDSSDTTKAFAKCLVKYLKDTTGKRCFTDWCRTKTPDECSFNHRSVQAGLWMPILKNKALNK
ncbi:MAG: glutaminase domain-containing protein [Acutalibacteraceae bacterium]